MQTRKKTYFLLLLGIVTLVWGLTSGRSGYESFFADKAQLKAPFQPGEKLYYEVNWKPVFFFPAFKAGEVHLELHESEYQGRETYKLVGWALSDGALARVIGLEVKNYFESQIDKEDFRSYQMTQRLREGSRHRNLELRFDYSEDKTVVHEEDPSETPPKVLRDETKPGIPGPAVDVLSIFFIGRLRSIKPGDHYELFLNEKGDFKTVQVVAEQFEKVRTNVGSYPSVKLKTAGGVFSGGGDFKLWLSTDELRMPTQFEANVKVGKVYGKLIRLETPQMTKGILRLN